MKKKIIIIIVVIILLILAGVGIYLTQRAEVVPDGAYTSTPATEEVPEENPVHTFEGTTN